MIDFGNRALSDPRKSFNSTIKILRFFKFYKISNSNGIPYANFKSRTINVSNYSFIVF